MLEIFRYNWQVREDWFSWCEQLWVSQMNGLPVQQKSATSLNEVRFYSEETKASTIKFIKSYQKANERRYLSISSKKGTPLRFSHEKVLHHIASHEIHPIGELSIWFRDIGLKPVSSDLIMRDIFYNLL